MMLLHFLGAAVTHGLEINRRGFLAAPITTTAVGGVPQQARARVVAWDREFKKSALDTRTYRLVELQNGLLCLLASDPEVESCACALEVGVGSLRDPFPGVAHLTEHSLFLGTKPYPRDDDWENFISGAGGSSNAFTEDEATRYFFDAPSPALPEALERWTPFFSSPLLDPTVVRREIGAIDAEHSKNLRSDGFRVAQVESSVREVAPFSHFATGNRDTLDRPDLLDALKNFYETYYRASDMKCVIVGRESLDQLQKAVALSALKDVLPARSSDEGRRLLVRGEFRTTPILVESLSSQRLLKLAWPVPCASRLEATRMWAEALAAHVLGHEGPQSLLADLRRRDLATALSAGLGDEVAEYREFEINVDLTERGLDAWRSVADTCVGFVDSLAATAEWPLHAVEEPRVAAVLGFKWTEPLPASALANALVSRLRLDPNPSELLSLGVVPSYSGKDLQAIASAFSRRLAAAKPLVTVVGLVGASSSSSSEREPIYGTRFARVVDYSPRGGNAASAFAFPRPNPYVPSPDIRPSRRRWSRRTNLGGPRKVFVGNCCCCWVSTESRGVPRAAALALFRRQGPASASEAVTAKLWRGMVLDALKEDDGLRSYDASLAGYGADVSMTGRGMTLQFAGYDEKLTTFVERALEGISVEAASWNRVRDALERSLERDVDAASPASRSLATLALILEPFKFSAKDQLEALRGVTLEDVRGWGVGWPAPETLLSGNLDPETVDRLSRDVAGFSSSPQINAVPPPRLRLAPQNADTVVRLRSPNKDETNVAVAASFQTGGGRRALALTWLLAAVVEPRFYESLRARQQLGYVVQGTSRVREGQASLVFLVQSDKASTQKITNAINDFVRIELREALEKLDDENFDQVREGLLENLLQKPTSLGALTSRYWDEIVAGTLDWDRREKDAKALRDLNVGDLAAFYQTYVVGEHRRSLFVQVDRPPNKSTTTTTGEEVEPVVFGRDNIIPLHTFIASLQLAPSLLDVERDDDTVV
ncbi:hypothetical protein CTAYLR_009277 [Chrysophaeum taylorii]|uniref:Insulin-degrading enzyme n=1 Tax=Chrysophaeum taylorii TaxID=2483200 RepID=A0AAD7XRD8_9STRA|nr:hypothetical protein CTAYLR_009277 [Chrysophaeum taylorii]